jgi:hypothetical protein
MKYIVMICIFIVTLYMLYALKCKLDINFNIGYKHTPQILEDKSFGFIKCRWFPNNHHCDK